MFSHMETLSIRYFNANKTGDLMSKFTNDNAVRMSIGPAVISSLMLRLCSIGLSKKYSMLTFCSVLRNPAFLYCPWTILLWKTGKPQIS
ncbi:MAG: hypothetical protein ACLRZ7_10765 [Lachnospiraceae bacterium]